MESYIAPMAWSRRRRQIARVLRGHSVVAALLLITVAACMSSPSYRPLMLITVGLATAIFVAYSTLAEHTRQAAEGDSRREYEKVIEGSQDLIAVIDRRYRYVLASKTYLRYQGLMPSQIVGHTVAEVMGAELFARHIKRSLDQCFGGETIQNELKYRFPRVGERTVLISYFPVGASERVTGVAVVIRDVTERQQAEARVRENEEKFRRAFMTGVDASYIQSLDDGRFLEVNDRFESVFGYGRNEVIGRTSLEMGLLTNPGDWQALMTAVRSDGCVQNLELSCRRKTGEIVSVLLSLNLLAGSEGQMALGVLRDTTEQKRVQKALVRLRQAVAASGEVIFTTDRDGVFTFVNPEFTRLYGFTEAEVLGRLTPRILKSGLQPPEKYASFWQGIEAKRIVRGQIVNRAKDGRLLTIESSVNPILDESGEVTGYLAIQRDVTDRKRAADALRVSEERFRRLSEANIIGIMIADARKISSGNDQFLKMIGYSREELQKGGIDWQRMTPPEFAELDRRSLAQLRERGWCDPFEKEFVRKDGRRVPILMGASRLDQYPPAWICFVVDLTSPKRVERQLQHSLNQVRALAARLQSVREEESKRLAREIHDQLGQALTALRMDVIALISEMPGAPQTWSKRASSMLHLVDDTIQTVRQISSQLRPGMLDYLGLVATVEWAGEEFEHRTGTKCRLDVPEKDIAIDSDRATAIYRILQEVLTNVTRHAAASEVAIQLAKQDEDVVLVVHDNGKGMPTDKFATRESLGILGMQERALAFGGEINITSAPGTGTTVTARIPAGLMCLTQSA